MEKIFTIKPKKDWIHIITQEVIKTKYGFKGEVIWYTDKNQTHQKISSIQLEENERFKKLFTLIDRYI